MKVAGREYEVEGGFVKITPEELEDLLDEAAFDAGADQETVPLDVAKQLLAGNPIKVWRNYRGLTQEALAERAGISQPMIVALEKGERVGSVDTLKKIAEILNVNVDDLC